MTCGYVCPQCEGSGFTAEGEVCDWCKPATPATPPVDSEITVTDEVWLKEVHEGKCCAGD
ncbi:MAG: hypothetical protein K1X81_03895 [Bacteroidia bacterium]|nr:hypothetical protein [Bacteroidia bacterium]